MARPAGIEIVRRAYEKPEGRDQEFYHQAEKELQGAVKESPSQRTPDNL